jgi:hypothetical protein
MAFSGSALAQDDASRAAARRLATAGVEAYQRDDFAIATDKLERAYQMLKAPSIGLWLARSLAKQGKLVAASERYLEVGRLQISGGDAAVQESAKREAAAEVEQLAPKIPNVVVVLEGAKPAEVSLTLDGVPLAVAVVGEQQPVDPGSHRVVGQRGGEQVTQQVTLAVSESKTVTLRFEASQPVPTPLTREATRVDQRDVAPREPSSSGRKVLAWSAIGVGAAGVLTGAITGALALSKKSELDDGDCVNRVCWNETMKDDLSRYSTLKTVSSIGFIAGGVLTATGVVLLVTAPKAHDTTAGRPIWLRIGATNVAAGGQF